MALLDDHAWNNLQAEAENLGFSDGAGLVIEVPVKVWPWWLKYAVIGSLVVFGVALMVGKRAYRWLGGTVALGAGLLWVSGQSWGWSGTSSGNGGTAWIGRAGR